MAKKKPIVSKEGQWKYPGQETIIPNVNGRITMRGVPYPVLGIDDLGNQQMMMPGAEYKFPGNSVYEIPMAKNGGTRKVKIHGLPRAQGGTEVPPEYETVNVTDPNDPAYQEYLYLQNLYNWSNIQDYDRRYQLSNSSYYGIKNRNSTGVFPASRYSEDYDQYNKPTFNYDTNDGLFNSNKPSSENYNSDETGYYGSKANRYTFNTKAELDNFIATNARLNPSISRRFDNNQEMQQLIDKYAPIGYDAMVDWEVPTINTYHAYTGPLTRKIYRRPNTPVIEDNVNREQLKAIYPRYSDEEIDKVIADIRLNPMYITNTRDIYGNNQHINFSDSGIEENKDPNYVHPNTVKQQKYDVWDANWNIIPGRKSNTSGISWSPRAGTTGYLPEHIGGPLDQQYQRANYLPRFGTPESYLGKKYVYNEPEKVQESNENYTLHYSGNPGVAYLYYKKRNEDGTFTEKNLGATQVKDWLDDEQQKQFHSPTGGTARVNYNPDIKIYSDVKDANSEVETFRKQQKNIEKRRAREANAPVAKFEYGGPLPKAQRGLATAADSSLIANRANDIVNFYKNAGYTKERRHSFTPGDPEFVFSMIAEDRLAPGTFQSGAKYKNGQLMKLGNGQMEPVWDTDIYQKLDNYKFQQRESAQGVLNMDSPMQLYDTRISPQYLETFNEDRVGGTGDAVGVYTYDKLAVTPWKKLTTKQRIQRLEKFGTSGSPYKDKASAIKELKAKLNPPKKEETPKQQETPVIDKPVIDKPVEVKGQPEDIKEDSKTFQDSSENYTLHYSGNPGVAYLYYKKNNPDGTYTQKLLGATETSKWLNDEQQKQFHSPSGGSARVKYNPDIKTYIDVKDAIDQVEKFREEQKESVKQKPKVKNIVVPPGLKYGGSLPKAQRGTYIHKQPRIIEVDSEDDPLIQAERDSATVAAATNNMIQHLHASPNANAWLQYSNNWYNKHGANSAFARAFSRLTKLNKKNPTPGMISHSLLPGGGNFPQTAVQYMPPQTHVVVRPQPKMKEAGLLPLPTVDIKPQLQNIPSISNPYSAKPKTEYFLMPSGNPGVGVIHSRTYDGAGSYSEKIIGPSLAKDWLNDEGQRNFDTKDMSSRIDYDPRDTDQKVYSDMYDATQEIEKLRQQEKEAQKSKKTPKVRIIKTPKFANGGDIAVPDLRRVKIDSLPKAQFGYATSVEKDRSGAPWVQNDPYLNNFNTVDVPENLSELPSYRGYTFAKGSFHPMTAWGTTAYDGGYTKFDDKTGYLYQPNTKNLQDFQSLPMEGDAEFNLRRFVLNPYEGQQQTHDVYTRRDASGNVINDKENFIPKSYSKEETMDNIFKDLYGQNLYKFKGSREAAYDATKDFMKNRVEPQYNGKYYEFMNDPNTSSSDQLNILTDSKMTARDDSAEHQLYRQFADALYEGKDREYLMGLGDDEIDAEIKKRVYGDPKFKEKLDSYNEALQDWYITNKHMTPEQAKSQVEGNIYKDTPWDKVRKSTGKFQRGGDVSIPDLKRVKIHSLPKAQDGTPRVKLQEIQDLQDKYAVPSGYVRVPDVVRKLRIAKGIPADQIPEFEKIEKKISPELQSIVDRIDARSAADKEKADKEKMDRDRKNFRPRVPNDPAGLPSVPIFEAAFMAPVAFASAAAAVNAPLLGTGVSAANILNPVFFGQGIMNTLDSQSDMRKSWSNLYNNRTKSNLLDAALETGLNSLNFLGARSLGSDLNKMGNYAGNTINSIRNDINIIRNPGKYARDMQWQGADDLFNMVNTERSGLLNSPQLRLPGSFSADLNSGNVARTNAGGSRNLGVYDYNGNVVKVVKNKRAVSPDQVALMQSKLGDMDNVFFPKATIDLGNNTTGLVMNKANGVDASKLTTRDINKIPEEHWNKFEQDVRELSNRGVQVDLTKRDNLFYDKDKGFSFIDINGISMDGKSTNKFIDVDGVEHYHPFEQYPFFPKEFKGGKSMFESIPTPKTVVSELPASQVGPIRGISNKEFGELSKKHDFKLLTPEEIDKILLNNSNIEKGRLEGDKWSPFVPVEQQSRDLLDKSLKSGHDFALKWALNDIEGYKKYRQPFTEYNKKANVIDDQVKLIKNQQTDLQNELADKEDKEFVHALMKEKGFSSTDAINLMMTSTPERAALWKELRPTWQQNITKELSDIQSLDFKIIKLNDEHLKHMRDLDKVIPNFWQYSTGADAFLEPQFLNKIKNLFAETNTSMPNVSDLIHKISPEGAKLIYFGENEPSFKDLNFSNQDYLRKNYENIGGWASGSDAFTIAGKNFNTPGQPRAYLQTPKQDVTHEQIKVAREKPSFLKPNTWLNNYKGPLVRVKTTSVPVEGSYPKNVLMYDDRMSISTGPERIEEIATHEGGHNLQNLYRWNRLLNKYDPKFGYYANDISTPLGKRFADAMVEPVPVANPGDNHLPGTWEADAMELHSELMVARLKEAKDLIKDENLTMDAAIERIKALELKGDEDLYKRYLRYGNLEKHFKPKAKEKEKIALLIKLPKGDYVPKDIGDYQQILRMSRKNAEAYNSNSELARANQDALTFTNSPANKAKLQAFRPGQNFSVTNQTARFIDDPEAIRLFGDYDPGASIEKFLGRNQGQYGARDYGDMQDVVLVDKFAPGTSNIPSKSIYTDALHEDTHSRSIRLQATDAEKQIASDAWKPMITEKAKTKAFGMPEEEAFAVQNELRIDKLKDIDGTRVYTEKDIPEIKKGLEEMINVDRHTYLKGVKVEDFDMKALINSLNKIGLGVGVGVVIGAGATQEKKKGGQIRKLQNGGPAYDIPKQLYRAPNIVRQEGREYYDPMTETIYMQPSYPNYGYEQAVKNHEKAHHQQKLKGRYSSTEYWPGPLKEPALGSTDDMIYPYYNRTTQDVYNLINSAPQSTFFGIPEDIAVMGFQNKAYDTPGTAEYEAEQMVHRQYGGDMPFGLPLKEQNIYTLPEYNQPRNPRTGEILPDPRRPNLGMGTGATEYKYTYGTDEGDIDVPSIVAGQYIGDQALDRYRLTGERFKTMTDPGSYSNFYDQIGQLGLMQEKHGGSVKRVKIKSLPKNWKTK